MTKVYGAIEGIDCPSLETLEYDQYEIEIEQYKKDLKAFCKTESKCPDAGKILKFPIADGLAQYMILSYKELIHVNEGDGYSFPQIESLTKADITNKIKQEKALDKLFGR